MKANKKKIIIIASLVVLLVATGVLNYFLSVKAAQKDSDLDAAPTFFATYRADREATRAEQILYLESILTSGTADEATIAEAQSKKLRIADAMEIEMVLEGLIKAKGFQDCVVTISTENVNIVVQDAELTTEEAAQIYNIVVTETSFTAPDIVIIPYV